MDSFVNMNILGNPVNWLIVTLILIFMGYAGFVVLNNAGVLLPKLPTA